MSRIEHWTTGAAKWKRNGRGDIIPPAASAAILPKLVAGSLAVGAANYAVPSGAVYVDAASGLDTNPGTIGAPFKTFAKAKDLVADNGAIVLRAGVYHEGVNGTGAYAGIAVTKPGVTVQNYPGEAVWFDGSSVVSGFVADTAAVPGSTVYRLDNWVTSMDRSPTFSFGADESTATGFQFVNPTYPAAPYAHQVFLDGVKLTQVDAISKLDTGKFYVAGTYTGGTASPSTSGTSKYMFTSSAIYLGDNPAGKTVRASDLQVAISLLAADCKIRGIGFRRYAASNAQLSAVKLLRDRNVMENCWIEDVSSSGMSNQTGSDQAVRNTTIKRCGLLGIHANNADNLTHYRVDVSFCNDRRFNYAPAEGNIKVTRQANYLLRESYLHDAYGKGFWSDESVYGVNLITNDITGNEQRGVVIELCGKAVVANCLIADNGADGVVPYNTTGLRIWNNTLVNNGTKRGQISSNNNPRSLVVYLDERAPRNSGSVGLDGRYAYPGPYPDMTWEATQIQHKNNVYGAANVQIHAALGDDLRRNSSTAKSYTTMGLDSDGNAFSRTSTSVPAWLGAVAGTANNSNPTVFTTLAAMRTGYAQEANSSSLDTGSYVQADGTILPANSAVLDPKATGLPSDIATLIGFVNAGDKHAGAWR